VDRREYLAALLAGLGAACADAREGSAEPPPGQAAASSRGDEDAAPGVKVVTDYARAVEARGTARENWGPAFEAAWREAAAEGTDVFAPAGTYRVRLKQGRGGWAPAITLEQPEKYRPARLVAPARGAVLRVEEWPAGAPRDLEVVRVATAVRNSAGRTDTATGTEVANLTVINAAARTAAWAEPHDYPGVGVRMAGIYGGAVTGCLFQGFSCAVVLGDEGGAGLSYLSTVRGCRMQYCNQALRVPPAANGTAASDNIALMLARPTSGPVAAFETRHATSSVFFARNHAEMIAGYMYGIGATVNVSIAGGRLESVHGAVRVTGTGSSPARGTQITGLSVDCDSLRFPAVWLERAAGTLLQGITFYQGGTGQPHLRLEPAAVRTTLMAVEAAGGPLRVVDPGRQARWAGWPAE
jgi:hypothetical protein